LLSLLFSSSPTLPALEKIEYFGREEVVQIDLLPHLHSFTRLAGRKSSVFSSSPTLPALEKIEYFGWEEVVQIDLLGILPTSSSNGHDSLVFFFARVLSYALE
jgi:hypothetical protein